MVRTILIESTEQKKLQRKAKEIFLKKRGGEGGEMKLYHSNSLLQLPAVVLFPWPETGLLHESI